MPDNSRHWPRFIAFLDMNAFFASIEQLDNPEYRGKPIGVTNGKTGTCLITCSYEVWRGEGVFQVQVTALDPRPEKGQTELFGDEEDRFHSLNKVMDDINNRYGEFTLTRATLMRHSDMPNVIAPAWKPYGHRQTIVPTTEKMKTAQESELASIPDNEDYSLAH